MTDGERERLFTNLELLEQLGEQLSDTFTGLRNGVAVVCRERRFRKCFPRPQSFDVMMKVGPIVHNIVEEILPSLGISRRDYQAFRGRGKGK
jgi:hypothetical protein